MHAVSAYPRRSPSSYHKREEKPMSSYDQNLLDEAPRATRAQLQEGYNVDLLEQPPRRTPSTRNPPPQTPQPAPVTMPLMSGIADTGSGEKFGSPTHISAAPKPRTSFWRSRNGVIAIVVIALIVIGAVVGGAVGGTVKKSSSNNTVGTSKPNSAGATSSASLVGVTPASDSSSTSPTGTASQAIAAGTKSAGFTPTVSPSTATSTATGQNIIRATTQ